MNCCGGKFDGEFLDDGKGGMEANLEETVRGEGERVLIGVGCIDIDIDVSKPYGEGANAEGEGA